MAKILAPIGPGPPTKPRPYRFLFSTRFAILLLGFLGVTNLSISYATIGFAMVCMLNHTAMGGNHSELGLSGSGCGGDAGSVDEGLSGGGGSFVWSETERANVIAGFGWGAVWLLAPAGWLADRYGPRLLFALGNILACLTLCLFPMAAAAGPWWAFGARFLTGMCSAVQFPCFIGLLSRWAPVTESGTFLGLGTLGYPLGAMAVMLLSGYLCTSFGWELIFYSFGGLMGVWAVVWLFIYRDDPADVFFIAPAEAEYIRAERCHQSRATSSVRPPWGKILTSPPALSALLAQFAFSWIVYFIAMYLPTYQEEVLSVDLRANGLYATLPYVAQALGRCLAGPVSDRLSLGSRTFSIKLFNSVCLGVPAVVFLALSLCTCREAVLAICLFSLSHFCVSSQIGGFQKAYLFMAPQLAGTLSALGQITGFTAAILMPYCVGYMTRGGEREAWHSVLYICSGVAAVGMGLFLLFGDGEEQAWSRPQRRRSLCDSSAERLCPATEQSEAITTTPSSDEALLPPDALYRSLECLSHQIMA